MAGIDRTSGHIGMSQTTRVGTTLRAVGGAAFNVAGAVGTAAAGIAGGPLASAAASSAVSALRSGASGGGGSGTALGSLTDQTNAATGALNDTAADSMQKAQQNQMDLFMLQQSVNAQSQSFNTLTNVQKAKHDAAMAAIQNTR